jgi:hypothetical protein
LIVRAYDVAAFSGPANPSREADEPNPSREKDDEPLESLTYLIMETVAPDSWRENGGIASLHRLGSVFVVTQTREVHAELARFLAELRRTSAAQTRRAE